MSENTKKELFSSKHYISRLHKTDHDNTSISDRYFLESVLDRIDSDINFENHDQETNVINAKDIVANVLDKMANLSTKLETTRSIICDKNDDNKNEEDN